MGRNETKYGAIIISTQKMIQIHGYNGFSYKDLALALELEITTALIARFTQFLQILKLSNMAFYMVLYLSNSPGSISRNFFGSKYSSSHV